MLGRRRSLARQQSLLQRIAHLAGEAVRRRGKELTYGDTGRDHLGLPPAVGPRTGIRGSLARLGRTSPLPLVTSSILLSEEFLQNNSWLILETLKLSESPASSEPSHG